MGDGTAESRAESSFERIWSLERPDPSLWLYYVFVSFTAGPFFLVPLAFLRLRYRSIRYRFDEEGVSMRWGVMFRREVHLTYARIQDIHLVSNAIERWLGLARIQIQTASGSSKAEMTLEGLPDFEAVRDFLYFRMRGLAEAREGSVASPLARELAAATTELKAIRELIEVRPKGDPS